MECFIPIQIKIITDVKSSRCSGRRKKTEGQAETKMGRWCDGRCREVGGMLQGIGTAGRSFRRRPWLKKGCCANDDDDDDEIDNKQRNSV